MPKAKALRREELARGMTYETFRSLYIAQRPGCAWLSRPWPCSRPATDLHHLLSRAQGGALMDKNNIAGLCREHHRAAHDHPAEARRLGLSRARWRGDEPEEATDGD